MSYIPTLLASLDTRLDELATEISTLNDARAALRTRTRTGPQTPAAHNRTQRTLPHGPTRQTKKPASNPRARTTDPEPGRDAEAVTASKSDASRTRGASTETIRGKRSNSSWSAEQLEWLLADARSGLSAGAIAEQAGVSYRRVLAQLRELETSGKVRRTGSRRTTLWHLITDEDRIAQRTAELERQAGTRRDDRNQRRNKTPAS